MKKLYFLILLALVAVNMAFAQKFNCEIELSNLTSTSVDVTFNPADDSTPYLYNILMDEVYVEYGEAGIAQTLKDQMDAEISRYAGFGMTITYDKFVKRGTAEKSFSGLNPNTQYVIFAYEVDMNTGMNVGDFAITVFTTPSLAQSENVITLSYDEKTRCLNITTTNDDPYFFIYETDAEYSKTYPDRTQTSLLSELQSWVDAARQWKFLDRFVFSGNQTIDVQEFYTQNLSDLGMRTNDYIAMVAPYSGAINGDVVYLDFHYDEPAVVVTEEKDLHIVDPYWKGVSDEESWWQVGGYTADNAYYLTISNNKSEKNSGTYTLADIDIDYTKLIDLTEGEEKEIRCIDVNVTIDAATGTIKADYTGADGVLYHVTFDHIDITEPSTDVTQEVNVHIESPNWTGVAITGSWWQVTGFSDDKMYYVTLANNYCTQDEGTYTLADMDMDYTKLFEYSTGSGKHVKCKDVTVEISKADNGAIIVKADYLGANGILYHLTYDPIGGETGGESGDYDMEDQDVVATFEAEKGIVEYYEEDGALVAQYVNDEETFCIAFYTASAVLEDGEYPINESCENGSVQAGEISGGYVFPTYFGYLTTDGNISLPLFLCTEGTVNVSHDAEGTLLLDVDAQNTWGRTAKIKVISQLAEGISTAKVNTVSTKKYLNRSGLVIEKNGMKLNAIGQRLK